MRFSWDEHKNLTNQRKHPVSFEVAARVFIDATESSSLTTRKTTVKIAGLRIGIVGPALLAVVYTVRDYDGEVIRLISARRADAEEKREYRQHGA